MLLTPMGCPTCRSTDVGKYGKTPEGKQRVRCRNLACQRQTFLLEYTHKGFLQEVKTQIIEMALNGSGIRDTARVLNVSPTTVISTLKKRNQSCNT